MNLVYPKIDTQTTLLLDKEKSLENLITFPGGNY